MARPECPAEFFIVHVGLVLSCSPELGYHFRVLQFELAHIAYPVDHITVLLVCQELKQELPQLNLAIVSGPVSTIRCAGLSQVWSLTQFYSVDFSKSRSGVKKCVFNKRTIKVCVSCC